jgi:DNA-binding Xre family transcriptional regulator
MPTKRLSKADKSRLQELGRRISNIILKERGYKSLDAFALDYHDEITKATLYQLCAGKRDMKFSTLLGVSRALETKVEELLKGI